MIMVVKSKDSLDADQLAAIQSVGEGFASKISRGISFYFSWLDATADKSFADTFNLSKE